MLKIKTILHPTDVSPHARSALALACSLVRESDGNLILLHVRPDVPVVFGEFGSLPPEQPESPEAQKKKMQELLPATFNGRAECHVLQGDAAREIVAMSQLGRADLIVMGTHGRTGLGRLLLGSVAERVVREAPCAVLTIKLPVAVTPHAAAPSERVAVEPPPEPADAMATVHSVINPVEAEIIRNALSSEGIRSVLEGAQQAAAAGVQAFPIKIQVRTADADRAARIIHKRNPR